MLANGGTNIHQGIMWGWRVLSPSAPFTQGRTPRTDSDDEHVRIMIVMSDGANFYWEQPSFNRTAAEAYGYGREERLGWGIDTRWEIQDVMNERTSETCENAKDDGISIYTVAFQISDVDTRTMMRNCANNPNMAFEAASNSELNESFERIAAEISRLRLSK